MPRHADSDTEYLRKLQDYYARNPVLPSYAAIGKLIGLRSTSSVSAFLDRLKAEGYVETTARRLKPTARFFERALMPSRVAAGLPSRAEDAPAEGLSVDRHLIRHPSRTFLINVKGDSMIDAGLLPGDTVIVERATTAHEGAIVVALVDDAYTVKRLAREKGRFVLRPENKAYPVLRPEAIEIAGIVVGSFRKYP